MIWIVRDCGVAIYKNRELVGIIPKANFPLLISDLALSIDRASLAGLEGSRADAAHQDAE